MLPSGFAVLLLRNAVKIETYRVYEELHMQTAIPSCAGELISFSCNSIRRESSGTAKFHKNGASRLVIIVTLLLAAVFLGKQSAAAQTFQHPGVLVSRAQLDFIKAQVNSQTEPMYSAYQKAVASSFGSLTYTIQGPPSGGIIDCGPSSNPNFGCSAEDSDGSAAVTQALLWYISGNGTYAQNAIRILNAYGRNLQGYTNSNAPLQAAWGSEKWPLAAEIIRYSNAGWSFSDIQTFQSMLTNVIQPMIENGSGSNGNWELSMIDGMMGIGVFNDDQALFNKATTFWQQRVPAYFYYHTDGSAPQPAPRGNPSWYGQTTFNSSVDGIAQETCRDFGHTEYSIAAATHAAETAHIQGGTLFESEAPRLMATLEFHTRYLLGAPVPSTVCGGSVNLVRYPTFEVGYNEFHNRLQNSLPNTLSWLEQNVRTQSVPVDWHMMVFETLTHGADAGVTPPPPPPPPGCITASADNSWHNSAFTDQTGTFTASFEVTPSASPLNAVVALSQGAQTTYPGFAVLARFNPSGNIDARNGGAYAAASTIPYSAGVSYHFRLVVNVPAHTYSIFVTPSGGGELTVGTDFAFRTEQNAVTDLNWWGAEANSSATGSIQVCNFNAGTTPPPPPPSCVTAPADDTWQNSVFTDQTGTFTASFDVTPSASPLNAVVGLSQGAQTAYTGFAALARFNPSGNIDARNGGAYAAASTIPYSAGVSYHFRLVVNVPAHTYSVFVTPSGGGELTVGTDFAFRTEQSAVTDLNWWGAEASSSVAGSMQVCNFSTQ